MTKTWTWRERSRRIKLLLSICWLLYVLVSVSLIILTVPPIVVTHPPIFAAVLAMYVLPAAWINLLWVYSPGYLFMSNGIRRVRPSDVVDAQISTARNRDNEYGVPALPTDLRTPIRAGAVSVPLDTTSTVHLQVVWDEYLFAATRALLGNLPLPQRTVRATLSVGRKHLTLAAGRWRPGIVLEIPIDSIAGVWDGSEISTIDSGRVLVVVVAKGDDFVLFPFEIVRWPNRPRDLPAAKALRMLVEARRRVGTN